MKYPKYGAWCKKNVIETIRRQKIHDSENYLAEFVFNPDSDLYSTGVYDFEVCDILWSINKEYIFIQFSLCAFLHMKNGCFRKSMCIFAERS